MDGRASWPLYELANYEGSGALLETCQRLLASALEEQNAGSAKVEREKSPHGQLKSSCATTSGYQTLDEQRQQQTGATGASPHDEEQQQQQVHRRRQQPRGKRLRNSNKSPDGPALVWWHLIERVSYGNGEGLGPWAERCWPASGGGSAKTGGPASLPAGAEGQRQASSALPNDDARRGRCELEFRFAARTLAKLCLELRRQVSPFLAVADREVARAGPQGAPAELATTSRKVSELSASQLAGQAAAVTSTSGSPAGLWSREAQLRRLSWRRKQQVEPQQHRRPLVRSETFTLPVGATPLGASKLPTSDREASGEQVAGGASSPRLGQWLADGEDNLDAVFAETLAPRAQSSSWSREPHARGKYGESLVHLLLIGHSNEHLILLVLLLNLWPELLFDVFESDKFRHLNCLHLAIAHGNERLLGHLLGLARASGPARCRALVEQRVSGSLFRPPGASANSNPPRGRQDPLTGGFWCDQLEHWPTANGREHLILFDRIKQVDERGPVYFGQTPLAWAVSFESKAMFEVLAGEGQADVLACDEQSNNCLHQLVINNQLNWTRFLVKFDGKLATHSNELKLTPFLLACHLGRVELFNELLELSAIEFWTYSSVRCCAYPLESLDSITIRDHDDHHDERAEDAKRSAVSVILESSRSSDEQKSALLSTGVIKKLLEEKWKIFARRLFYRDLGLTLVQLLLMTIAFFLRPARINIDYLQEAAIGPGAAEFTDLRLSAGFLKKFLQDRSQQLLRNTCELIVLAISLTKVRSFLSEWARYRNLRMQFAYNPMVANLVLANALVVLCLPVRLVGAAVRWFSSSSSAAGERLRAIDQLEDFLLILASPLLWSSLLFFVAAFYVTGPFVAMISYMLMRDLKQFSLIYLIFLYSFAQSIFFINFQPPSPGPQVAQNQTTTATGAGREGNASQLGLLLDWLLHLGARYLELWLELFKMTLGVYEFQPYRHSLQSRILLTLFLQLIPVLFNMLIAMMNNTYGQVIAQSERAWGFQWARALFALERRLDEHQREAYLREYAINLSTSIKREDEDEQADSAGGARLEASPAFVPGLMIIKRTDCTRAELKRRLVGHWRRATRRILAERTRAGELVAPPGGPERNESDDFARRQGAPRANDAR